MFSPKSPLFSPKSPLFRQFFSDEAKESNFHPVSSAFTPSTLFGPLEDKDLEWAQGPGFATETQVWYQVLENGVFLFCQIIHSSVGFLSPTVQFTCKIFDPATGQQTWRSVNVNKFTTPPPATTSRTFDKRSSQSDKFKIFHSAATETANEQYKIDAQPDDKMHISITVERPSAVPGFKLGPGPQGGFSYFGTLDHQDGMVVHRFWPRTEAKGIVMYDGKILEVKGFGMFVHAIQGMRPNLIAQRWNFAHFLSGEGVSAVMMEFQTPEAAGRLVKGAKEGEEGRIQGEVKVNVGCVVADGKLVAVTGETQWVDENEGDKTGVVSRCLHQAPALDKETGYNVPSSIEWVWKGPTLPGTLPETGDVSAKLVTELGSVDKPRGLLEKVDVLAEIPYMVRKMINYVAGTKPYIYQYFNTASIELTLPGQERKTVHGSVFLEASFVSNPTPREHPPTPQAANPALPSPSGERK